MKKTCQHLSPVIAAVFFINNCCLIHAAPSDLWSMRAKSISKSGVNGDSARRLETQAQLASLPTFLSNGMPFLQNPPPRPLSAPVSGSMKRLMKEVPDIAKTHLESLLFSIPNSYGTVRKIVVPSAQSPSKTVVFVQDVHLNQEAQPNIGKLVEELSSKKQIDMIGLEGVFGPVDFSPYQTYPDQRVVKIVSDYLLKTGKISGAVYAAMTSQGQTPAVMGVDDKFHYDANVSAYLSSKPKTPSIKAEVQREDAALRKKQKLTFNRDLLAFESTVNSYRSGEVPLYRYVSRLLIEGNRSAEEAGEVSASVYPQANLLFEAGSLESSLNIDRVQQERTRLLEILSMKMDKLSNDRLFQSAVAYRMGQITHADFYETIDNLCAHNGVRLTGFPEMNRYIQYVLLSDSIDMEKLTAEIKSLEKAIYSRLIKSPEEKTLIETSRRLYLAGRLINFALTPEEWSDYKNSKSQTLSIKPASKSSFPGISSLNLFPFERFYEEAEIRNHLLASNLVKSMQTLKANTALLVAGGYHAAGVVEELKKAGVTTILYVPKITQAEAEDGSSYLTVFAQEKTPLQKLFAGEKLFVAPSPKSPPEGNAMMVAVQTGLDPAKARLSSRQFLPALGIPLKTTFSWIGQTLKVHLGYAKILLTITVHSLTAESMQDAEVVSMVRRPSLWTWIVRYGLAISVIAPVLSGFVAQAANGHIRTHAASVSFLTNPWWSMVLLAIFVIGVSGRLRRSVLRQVEAFLFASRYVLYEKRGIDLVKFWASLAGESLDQNGKRIFVRRENNGADRSSWDLHLERRILELRKYAESGQEFSVSLPLRMSDGPNNGSAWDLFWFAYKVTLYMQSEKDRYALGNVPSVLVIPSRDRMRWKIEPTSQPEVLEYWSPKKFAAEKITRADGGWLHEWTKAAGIDLKGRLKEGKNALIPFIFMNLFGFRGGIRITEMSEIDEIASDFGGQESSDIFTLAMILLAAQTAGVKLSEADALTLGLAIANHTTGGNAGGQGFTTGLGGLKQTFYLINRMLYPDDTEEALKRKTIMAVDSLKESWWKRFFTWLRLRKPFLKDWADHTMYMNAGVQYLNGKKVTQRSDILTTGQWDDIMREFFKRDSEEFTARTVEQLRFEMVMNGGRDIVPELRLWDEVQIRDNLVHQFQQIAGSVQDMQRRDFSAFARKRDIYIDTRDLTCRQWMTILTNAYFVVNKYGMEKAQQILPAYAIKFYKSIFEDTQSTKNFEPIRQMFKNKELGSEQFWNLSRVSTYTFGPIGEATEAMRNEGISMGPLGAGGPGTSNEMSVSDPSRLRGATDHAYIIEKLCAYYGKIKVFNKHNDQDFNEMIVLKYFDLTPPPFKTNGIQRIETVPGQLCFNLPKSGLKLKGDEKIGAVLDRLKSLFLEERIKIVDHEVEKKKVVEIAAYWLPEPGDEKIEYGNGWTQLNGWHPKGPQKVIYDQNTGEFIPPKWSSHAVSFIPTLFYFLGTRYYGDAISVWQIFLVFALVNLFLHIWTLFEEMGHDSMRGKGLHVGNLVQYFHIKSWSQFLTLAFFGRLLDKTYVEDQTKNPTLVRRIAWGGLLGGNVLGLAAVGFFLYKIGGWVELPSFNIYFFVSFVALIIVKGFRSLSDIEPALTGKPPMNGRYYSGGPVKWPWRNRAPVVTRRQEDDQTGLRQWVEALVEGLQARAKGIQAPVGKILNEAVLLGLTRRNALAQHIVTGQFNGEDINRILVETLTAKIKRGQLTKEDVRDIVRGLAMIGIKVELTNDVYLPVSASTLLTVEKEAALAALYSHLLRPGRKLHILMSQEALRGREFETMLEAAAASGNFVVHNAPVVRAGTVDLNAFASALAELTRGTGSYDIGLNPYVDYEVEKIIPGTILARATYLILNSDFRMRLDLGQLRRLDQVERLIDQMA